MKNAIAALCLVVSFISGCCTAPNAAALRYRFVVTEGVPLDDPEAKKLHKVVLDEVVLPDQPFHFERPGHYTKASGVLLRRQDGLLHFTGDIEVGPSGSSFDIDIRVGTDYEPSYYGFSGAVVSFFIRFERI